MVYSDAWGKLIHEKNQKSKISWHCPFIRRYNHNLDWICEDEGVEVQAQLAHVGTAGAHGQHAGAEVDNTKPNIFIEGAE